MVKLTHSELPQGTSVHGAIYAFSQGHLLILLHPLRLHQLPQSPYFVLIVPPKSDDAFARDNFEPSLFMRRANVTAIDTHRDRTIG